MGKLPVPNFAPETTSGAAETDAWLPSSQIIRELETVTGSQCPVTFRRLIDLAASNRVPLELRNGRWGVQRSRLLAVAAALRMSAVKIEEPIRRRRGASAEYIAA